ncbi:MAG: hypothetical protein IPG74_12695 [Flavobacteriales bacterium]|nr:hypothetical protein [Flavobacteriales bacterium]
MRSSMLMLPPAATIRVGVCRRTSPSLAQFILEVMLHTQALISQHSFQVLDKLHERLVLVLDLVSLQTGEGAVGSCPGIARDWMLAQTELARGPILD